MKAQPLIVTLFAFLSIQITYSSQLCFAQAAASGVDTLLDSVLQAEGDVSRLKAIQMKVLKDAAAPRLVTQDQTDKKAMVYEVVGTVRIAKKSMPDWKTVENGQIIDEGDILLTEKASSVAVTFDENRFNVVRLPENTRVIFRAIEPTNIYLQDGTVYNAVLRLPEDSSFKISTPVAVAAVRGTFYVVNFTAANGNIVSAVLDVPEDSSESSIELIDILENGEEGASVNVSEGNQISLSANETPDPSLLQGIDPRWIGPLLDLLNELAAEGGELPPTGEDFPETDPANSNNVDESTFSADTVRDNNISDGDSSSNPPANPDSNGNSDNGDFTSEHNAFHAQQNEDHENFHDEGDFDEEEHDEFHDDQESEHDDFHEDNE